ncbi:MAG: hypothetical protein FWC38_10105 [Proteobacteria bacterium]|nr:hypothetical protein [Pseudomonadota bacterium]MCL2308549.1 hypothetical protein [Pseudomonadota bacterium]
MKQNRLRPCFSLFVAASLALGAIAPAYSQSPIGPSPLSRLSITGIWAEDPTPQGSSWGVNFAQSGDFIFATLYVYGEDGKPTWYTGELQHAYTFGSNCGFGSSENAYSGPLYRTAGGSATNMFTPSGATTTEAGKVTLLLSTPTTGQLCVQIGDTLLTKNIKRLTLTAPTFGATGHYLSTGTIMVLPHPLSPSYLLKDMPPFSLGVPPEGVPTTGEGVLRLTFEDVGASTGNIDTLYGGVCMISGKPSVEGSFYVIKNAGYSCIKGGVVSRNTTADVYLRFNKNGGMEGYWVSKADEAHGGYRDEASFSAIYTSPPITVD